MARNVIFCLYPFWGEVHSFSKLCHSDGLFPSLKKSSWKEIDYPVRVCPYSRACILVSLSLSHLLCLSVSLSVTPPVIPSVDLKSWVYLMKGLWSVYRCSNQLSISQKLRTPDCSVLEPLFLLELSHMEKGQSLNLWCNSFYPWLFICKIDLVIQICYFN